MNDTRPHRPADDAAIRRLVTEMVADAPPASDWSQIQRRVDQPNRAAPSTEVRFGRPRPGLMLVAAAATAALVGGAALVATRGSGPDDRLVPADSEVPTTTAEEIVTSTTEAPLFVPVPTTQPIPAEPTPVTPAPTDVFANDPLLPQAPDDPPVIDSMPEPLAPVDYPERALADVTQLPLDAWVVAATLPDGIVARYATGGPGRTVAYGNQQGSSLTIDTHGQPGAGGEPLDIAGTTWTTFTTEDGVTYSSEIGPSTVEVHTVGIDRQSAIAILGDLRTGGDQLLPVEVIKPLYAPDDSDLVANEPVEDDGGFGMGPTAFRAQGVNGWYCIEVSVPSASVGGCGYSRNGQLASETITVGEMIDEAGVTRVGFAGIVSPDVSVVEVVLVDGSTHRATPDDLSGLNDDRFWITRIELDSSEPFINPLTTFEVRLYGDDGSLLGTAPVPEF